MKKYLFMGILAASISTCGYAQAENEPVPAPSHSGSPSFVCLDSTHVSVQVLSKPLPTQSDSLRTFLWESFIRGPEPEKFKCLVRDWKALAGSFASTLVNKARADSLNSVSLRACLDHVLSESGRNAYLPISAAFADFKGKPAWVILVNWEWADSSPHEVFGHSRVYVMDATDIVQLGFATCD